MILLEASRPWKCTPLTFQEGAFYVEASTAATALHTNEHCRVRTIDNPRPWDPAQDWNGKRVLLVRSGGFGDLLFLTPLLRAMRQKWPRASFSFAVTPYYREALQGHPVIDALINYPVRAEVMESYDAVLWFEGLIEWSKEARMVNSVDLHAQFAGVPLTDGKHMDYFAHEPHMESMRRRFPRHATLPRIGVQLSASAKCRTYPGKLMQDLLVRLTEFAQVVLFDAPREDDPPEPDERIICLPTERPPLSFAQSAAVLADCDAVIAPDSALCHVAGALNRPTVALYGPFPWQLRTVHASSIHGINGTCSHGPCYWHDRESLFPPDGPCRHSGRCEALASIEPRRIVSQIKKMLP